jgi:hypothetical protein
MVSYEAYESKLDAIGEAILNWSDKERNFRGYTEVREWIRSGRVNWAIGAGPSIPFFAVLLTFSCFQCSG